MTTDASAELLAIASFVGTIAIARARALSARRLAFAYLGGLAGMIVTANVVGAPFMIVAHGNRPTASTIAVLAWVGVLAAGIATGVVVADRKRTSVRWRSLQWVATGSALSVLVIDLVGALRVDFASPLSAAALFLLLLLLPVLGWTVSATREAPSRATLP